MSRVGKREHKLPEGTTIEIKGNVVTVKGKNGELTKEFADVIDVKVTDGVVTTTRANEEKHTKQLHGTTNSLIQGMIEGVTNGFKKEIEIKGVGYKANLQGTSLVVNAGYSHPHTLEVPKDVKVEVPKPTEIIITGADKQKVGHFAALIRDIRRPNPYSGKGIMYKGEVIRRKEGKAAAK